MIGRKKEQIILRKWSSAWAMICKISARAAPVLVV